MPGCSLSTLAECTNLQFLSLRRCGLNSLHGLNNCKKLKYIDVQVCPVLIIYLVIKYKVNSSLHFRNDYFEKKKKKEQHLLKYHVTHVVKRSRAKISESHRGKMIRQYDLGIAFLCVWMIVLVTFCYITSGHIT